MFHNLKIAIVYDWIDKWGGVERVLLTLHQMFPQAEFYTSYFDPKQASWARDLKIKTSFIDKLPYFFKKNRILSTPFYPYAFESFDFSNFNLVVSVTSSFAKSIITKPKTLHLCYLLTPTRYLWIYPELYFKNRLIKTVVSPYLAKLRQWDFISAQRPDYIISISKTVAERCQKYYQRGSEVIYPPFDTDYWQDIKNVILRAKPEESLNLFKKLFSHSREIPRLRPDIRRDFARNDTIGSYYLLVSRLEPYKRVDIVVQSFNRLNDWLIIDGKGSQLKTLKKQANKNILFFQDLTDQELGWLYQKAQALIMPQEEDFGYTSLEAQFFDCPVIAYKKGGTTETVIENKTAIFFEEQTQNSLLQTLKKFHTISYALKNKTTKLGVVNIKKFSKEIFINSFKSFINLKLKTQISNLNLKS
jgi:glycosyltransferase involved in cell wall biosynthesis